MFARILRFRVFRLRELHRNYLLLMKTGLCLPELESWIREQVTFPNSMVDRITPMTKQTDIERLRSVYGIDDKWPAVCEPFTEAYIWSLNSIYSAGISASVKTILKNIN